MAQEYTELVDVLPANSLRTVLEFVRGNSPGTKSLVLAALNVQSYAASQFVVNGGEPVVLHGTAELRAPTRAEFERAVADVLPDESGTMKAGIGIGAWLVILKTIAPLILDLLKK